jgi:uncharacterized protein
MVTRRGLFSGLSAAAAAAAGLGLLVPRDRLNAAAQDVAGTSERPFADVEAWAAKLIAAAESQVGRTVRYDPAYVRLDYPMGDIPEEGGVCTDVVIRAYRSAHNIDLQQLVHEDMRKAFASYPKTWGLRRPDRNIDHRRVPNLERFLARKDLDLPVTANGADYRPGDLVTQRLPGNLPHIAIVTHRPADGGTHPLVVHNVGAGARIEDRLFEFPIVGHFRFPPQAA